MEPEPEPVFTNMLTDTDVNHRLCFPTEHLRILPQPAVLFPVQCGNEERMFCWRRRREGSPKPVIEVGWSRLARERGLQKGDELQFYWEANNGGAPRYWIKIYRYVSHTDEMGAGWNKIRIV